FHYTLTSSTGNYTLSLHDALPIWEIEPVRGCLDVDLGITPSTNTLPIRRLGLAVGQAKEVRAAWIVFPELEVRLLTQTYTRLDRSEEHTSELQSLRHLVCRLLLEK